MKNEWYFLLSQAQQNASHAETYVRKLIANYQNLVLNQADSPLLFQELVTTLTEQIFKYAAENPAIINSTLVGLSSVVVKYIKTNPEYLKDEASLNCLLNYLDVLPEHIRLAFALAGDEQKKTSKILNTNYYLFYFEVFEFINFLARILLKFNPDESFRAQVYMRLGEIYKQCGPHQKSIIRTFKEYELIYGDIKSKNAALQSEALSLLTCMMEEDECLDSFY